MTAPDESAADAVRELLRDAFTRQAEHVDDVVDGLTEEVAYFRPGPGANPITWLLWHTARMQDAQVCEIAGVTEVYLRDGWFDRFALDLPPESHGFGHTAAEVAKVRVPAAQLADYYRGVHAATLEYVATLTAAELDRVVDHRWTPAVTAGARLVSVVDDSAQHLGQASYLKGLAP